MRASRRQFSNYLACGVRFFFPEKSSVPAKASGATWKKVIEDFAKDSKSNNQYIYIFLIVVLMLSEGFEPTILRSRPELRTKVGCLTD